MADFSEILSHMTPPQLLRSILENTFIVAIAVLFSVLIFYAYKIIMRKNPRESEVEIGDRSPLSLSILVVSLFAFLVSLVTTSYTTHERETEVVKYLKLISQSLPNDQTQKNRHQELISSINQTKHPYDEGSLGLSGLKSEITALNEIRDLLENSLEEHSNINRQLTEIREKIGCMGEDCKPAPAESTVSISWVGAIVLLLLAFLPIAVVFLLKNNSKLWVKSLVLLLAMFLSSITFFSLSLSEKFYLFSININTPPEKKDSLESKINISINSAISVTASCLEENIGPFSTGKSSELESGQDLSQQVRSIAKIIRSRSDLGVPELIVLVGSSDRQQLKPKLAKIYGSNLGLAQARALRVKTLLKQALEPSPPAMYALSTGPSATVDIELSNAMTIGKALAVDRSVRVCGVFNKP